MILQSHASDPQAWALVAAPGCVLALPTADLVRFDGVAERLAAPDGFRAVLELLIAEGIASAPPFALLDGDASVARVVLRGEATVTVTAVDPDAAELTIGGAGMATWSERVLEGASSLRLHVPGSTWTLTLEPAGAAVVAPSTAATAPAAEAPVAETTLAPKAEIEVPVALPTPTPTLPLAAGRATAPVAHGGADADTSAGDSGYDFLFGDTIYRTQSGASIRIPNPDPERPGDHDGRTMLAEELGLAGRVPAIQVFPELPMTSPAASEATVLAPIPGHVPAAATPVVLALTPQLQLERADGSRESLDRPVLIGRAPSASAASTAAGTAPRLITIAAELGRARRDPEFNLATNRRLRLVEYAIATRLVTRDDLALLDRLGLLDD